MGLAGQPTEPLQHPTYTLWPMQRDRPLPKPGVMSRVTIPGSSVLRVRAIPFPWAPLSDASLASLPRIVLGPRHPQSSSWWPEHCQTDPLRACAPTPRAEPQPSEGSGWGRDQWPNPPTKSFNSPNSVGRAGMLSWPAGPESAARKLGPGPGASSQPPPRVEEQ